MTLFGLSPHNRVLSGPIFLWHGWSLLFRQLLDPSIIDPSIKILRTAGSFIPGRCMVSARASRLRQLTWENLSFQLPLKTRQFRLNPLLFYLVLLWFWGFSAGGVKGNQLTNHVDRRCRAQAPGGREVGRLGCCTHPPGWAPGQLSANGSRSKQG